MKVKWRQHEMIMATLLAVFTLLRFVAWLFNGPFMESAAFYHNIITAQVITLVIQYGCYVWLNKLVIAKLAAPRTLWQPVSRALIGKTPMPARPLLFIIARYALIIVQFIVIVYLLGPACNFVAYYFTQDFIDKGIINAISSILPHHPQEFFNTFGGFDIALFFVSIYLLYAALREAAIYSIEKNDGGKAYRVLVVNQLTLFAGLYLTVVLGIAAFSSALHPGAAMPLLLEIFIFIVPSVLTVAAVNIYKLFPSKGDAPLFSIPRIRGLVLLPAACAVPVMFLQRAQSVGPWPFFFGAWIFHLFITTPIAWLIYQQRKDEILRLRGIETELSQSKAGIQFLRSQINPHFLFNALNTLYGTALQEGSERTAEGIQKLGDIMRFMLHDNTRDFIPMQRELEYLQNYISLQKLRIQSSPNITIEENIDSTNCLHKIAPMLLIPFVENAFKHGISLVEPSWINITLACDETTIRFSVRNSMHAKQAIDTEKSKSGIGLKNVAERIRLLYPGRHSFSASGNGKEFVATLHIQP